MNVLIGCEESQIVTEAFLNRGHNAYSCDIISCSGNIPERHIQEDVFKVLMYGGWDLVILHPPCTKLSVSGNRWYGKGTSGYTERCEAVGWTWKLWNLAVSVCNKVALENPVGVLNSMGNFPKPQYIQPWQFGHGETKKTGLWLDNLPKLKETDRVEGREQRIWKMPPSKDRAKMRSKTFPGIAKAMAEQWG